jgi:tetratricopeptide (TPR) repeat protein
MATVLTRYLGLLVWPAPSQLNSVYILFVKGSLDGQVALGLGLAAALAALGAYLWLRQRRLCFGFGVFVVGLIPVSQLVPLATLMNDRYLYFPMLGVTWLAGGVLSALAERFPGARPNPGQLVAAALIVPCLLFSYQRCQVWRDAVTLWSDVAGKYPTLRDQRAALAAAYLYADNKQKALETYQQVFALKRDFNDPSAERKAYFEASRLYLEAGAPEKALPLLTTLTGKFPDFQPGQRLIAECRGRLAKTY